MERKEPFFHKSAFSLAAIIALSSAIVCLLITTFLLCSGLIEQLLPLILLLAFFLIAFFAMRSRWAKTRVWLFYALCAVFAVACGLLIRAVF